MPRPASISYEDVARCAEGLLARGASATARAVRAELGSGSLQTVTALLREWRNRPKANQDTETALDPAITRAVSAYVTQAVASAVQAHQARIAALDADLVDSLKEQETLAETLAERDQALEALRAERSAQVGRIEQMADEMHGLREGLREAQAEAAAAKVAVGKAEVQVEALSGFRTEVERLRAEVDALRQEAASLSKAAAVAEARLEAELKHRQEP